MQDTAAIYVLLHKARRELHVESPILRLAASQQVPMMRSLLELGEQLRCGIRPCLRGDLVVLRFWDRMARVSPPRLLEASESVNDISYGLDSVLRSDGAQ